MACYYNKRLDGPNSADLQATSARRTWYLTLHSTFENIVQSALGRFAAPQQVSAPVPLPETTSADSIACEDETKVDVPLNMAAIAPQEWTSEENPPLQLLHILHLGQSVHPERLPSPTQVLHFFVPAKLWGDGHVGPSRRRVSCCEWHQLRGQPQVRPCTCSTSTIYRKSGLHAHR